MNCSLTGSSVPWNSLGKNTGVSGLPFPTPGDLSNPGIKFAFPAFLLHLESPPAMLEAEKRWQVSADWCQCLENSLNWSLRNILRWSGGLNLGQKVALPPLPWPSLTRMERMSCLEGWGILPMRRRECGRVGSSTTLRASNRPLAMGHASLRASSGSTGCPVSQSNPLLTEAWDSEDCTIPTTNLAPGSLPFMCTLGLCMLSAGWEQRVSSPLGVPMLNKCNFKNEGKDLCIYCNVFII